MSFSNDCKAEILSQDFSDIDIAESLLYGFICFFPRISFTEMSINSENLSVLEQMRIILINSSDFPQESIRIQKGIRVHTLKIEDESVCSELINRFQVSRFGPSFHFLNAFLQTDEQKKAFLCGVFLACGSMSSPDKGYHLQFSSHRRALIRALGDFMTELQFSPRESMHGNHYMLYIKNSGQIEDLLAYMGAFDSTLRLMEEKVFRDVKNSVTRRVNCENANLEKTIHSSSEDVALFRELLEQGGAELLSEEQLKLARCRMEHPEYSFSELAGALEESLSKSGVNHRLRRIREIARNYFESNRDQK